MGGAGEEEEQEDERETNVKRVKLFEGSMGVLPSPPSSRPPCGFESLLSCVTFNFGFLNQQLLMETK